MERPQVRKAESPGVPLEKASRFVHGVVAENREPDRDVPGWQPQCTAQHDSYVNSNPPVLCNKFSILPNTPI